MSKKDFEDAEEIAEITFTLPKELIEQIYKVCEELDVSPDKWLETGIKHQVAMFEWKKQEKELGLEDRFKGMSAV